MLIQNNGIRPHFSCQGKPGTQLERRDESGRKLGFHNLRYFFAKEMGRRLPIQVVKKLLTHETLSMTADLGNEDVTNTIEEMPLMGRGNECAPIGGCDGFSQ